MQTLSSRGTWDTPGGGSPQDRAPGGRQVGLGRDLSCPCVGGGACSVGPRRCPAPAPTPQSRTSTWLARVLGTLPCCSGCPAGLCAAARLPGEAPPASSAIPPGAWGCLRRALHLRPRTRHASAGAAGQAPSLCQEVKPVATVPLLPASRAPGPRTALDTCGWPCLCRLPLGLACARCRPEWL